MRWTPGAGFAASGQDASHLARIFVVRPLVDGGPEAGRDDVELVAGE